MSVVKLYRDTEILHDMFVFCSLKIQLIKQTCKVYQSLSLNIIILSVIYGVLDTIDYWLSLYYDIC